MVKARNPAQRQAKPLDAEALNRLGQRQVARFSMTPKAFTDYLRRKIRQRGWQGEADVNALVPRLVQHFQALGLLSEEAVAGALLATDSRRGLASSLTRQRMALKGVSAPVAEAMLEDRAQTPLALAVSFARRRRLGPFADAPVADPAMQRRALGAMARAGHAPGVALKVLRAVSAEALEDEIQSGG